ncbi:zinc finger BED domain-containing protein RICESLEEPER 2-like [Amaranthus tricolor]|uniref:zinc finger BED domain-containing protein RICESLEEPER 2-like n=1 Tax=Amaranthus tricolor TaxID=29722 RepID=UPI0025903DB9|nr:zinc finger BED domain-containing protein RICESLEEPER 2-like [Amaranthus tricolor]
MWHLIVDEGYLSFTAHYIDDDWKLHYKIIAFCHVSPPHNANMIHERLIALIKEWKFQQKVFSITLDNAKYNDNMQKLLVNSLSVYNPLLAYGDYFHVHCGAHILNFIVQDGLKVIGDEIKTSNTLVKYINGFKVRKEKLRECAIGIGVSISKRLWLDCPIRWNSTYRMLERALIYCPCYENLKRIDKDLSNIPTHDDWSKVKEIVALLKPFDDITKYEDEFLKDMAKNMKNKFDKYWENYSVVLSFAAMMDPQYVRNDTPYGHEASSKVVDDDLPGFSSFARGTSENLSELDIYLEESRLDHHLALDVLQWWKTNETRHPQVARMSRDLLVIPITTVASQSPFRLGGRVLTKYRASLQPDTAEGLITSRS